MAKKLNLVDMYGIGLMLEHLVAEGNITCEERDRVILRIARENDIAEYMLSNLAGYGRSKQEVLERAKRRKGLESQGKKQEEGYISLTEVARAHSEDAPGYVIQSWLRSGNTLAFLNLWEQENNPNYSETGYAELLKRKKTASFTLTPKLWIDQTKAIGIVSKQGKNGGTFAHPMIACEFASWIAPEFKMQYDCVLDDVLQTDEIKHLHGGFFYKKQDRQKRSDTLLGPDDACLIWGISGEEKEEEMKLGGGFTFPIQFPLESPMTIFQIYLSQLQNANAGRIDIFGYSGENDQHINRAIAQNPSIREIHYYCAPAKVSDPVEEFEVASRFSIKAPQKLMLESWNTIWNIFEQN